MGEAILTTNYILNKIPLKGKETTPYELWKGKKPSYKYLKVWGYLAKVMVPPPKEVIIALKTIDCIFIGYALNSSAYRFVVHKFEISTITVGTTIESRNAVFLENTFPCKDQEELTTNSESRIEDEATSSKSVDEEP